MSRRIFFLRLYYGVILVLRINNQIEQFSFFSSLRQVKKLNFVSHSDYTLRKLFSNYPVIPSCLPKSYIALSE